VENQEICEESQGYMSWSSGNVAIKGSQLTRSGKALKIKLFRTNPCLMLKRINENSEIFQWNGFFNGRLFSTPSGNNSKGLIDSSSISSSPCLSSE
jgi:hypothetical protein